MNRLKPPINGATTLTRTPPPEMLPAEIRSLLEEHAQLVTMYDVAANESRELLLNRGAHDQDARRADADLAATAARTGGDVTARPHADALAARREEVAQRTAALEMARDQVAREIETARNDWISSGEPGKRAAAATAKLAKAGEAFTRAVTEAFAATAAIEWGNGEPYDATPLVALLDLDPRLATTFGARGNDLPQGIHVLPAINAITAILKEHANV